MKNLLILALFALTVYQVASVLVLTGNFGSYKMQGLKVRTAIYEGGSGWDKADTGLKKPSSWNFNVSTYPYPQFIAQSKEFKKSYVSEVLQSTKVAKYFKLETNDGFAVQGEDKQTDVLPYLTGSNELTVQRKNFYSCVHYTKGSDISSKSYVYSNQHCTQFSLPDLNENQNNINANDTKKAVEYGSVGKVYWYFDYVHDNDLENIPLYLHSVRVNKITAFIGPLNAEDEAFPLDIRASTSTFSASYAGSDSSYWTTGFSLGSMTDPKNLDSGLARGGSNSLSISVFQKKQYKATGESGSYYYSSLENAVFSNLLDYCGRTTQFANQEFEVELQVNCSSATMMKIATAAFFLFAGLFALF